eukprot:747695-Hanusia_phi.AAC.2
MDAGAEDGSVHAAGLHASAGGTHQRKHARLPVGGEAATGRRRVRWRGRYVDPNGLCLGSAAAQAYCLKDTRTERREREAAGRRRRGGGVEE